MKDYGFVKLYRSLHDWEWYTEPNATRLFIHFLITVNYKEKKWQGITVMPGQVITSRSKLAKELKLSEQEIRTAINRLKSTNNITVTSTSRYSLVTLCNWEFYQSAEDDSTSETTSNLTNNQPAINQQSTSNQPQLKNTKNDKNDKKIRNKGVLDFSFIENQDLISVLKDFEEHRKNIKKPMTQRSLELIVGKLNKWTKDTNKQIEIINRSIENGWVGIFQPSEQNKNKKSTVGNFEGRGVEYYEKIAEENGGIV